MTSNPVHTIRRALIEEAAKLVRGEHLPSCFDDDNFYKSTPVMERRRVRAEIEKLAEHGKRLALRLRDIADILPGRLSDETLGNLSQAHAKRILQDWIEDDAHAESLRHWPDLRAAYEALRAVSESASVEPKGDVLHDEECDNCGAPWSKHLTNKLICPDAAIAEVYRFRQKGQPVETKDLRRVCTHPVTAPSDGIMKGDTVAGCGECASENGIGKQP